MTTLDDMDLQPIEVAALERLYNRTEKAAIRKHVRPGVYDIDLDVKVKGRLTVPAGEFHTPTVSIPLLATLALALRYSGVTREKTKEALLRAATDAVLKGQGVEDTLTSELPWVKKALEELREELGATLPKAFRAGKIKAEAKAHVKASSTAEHVLPVAPEGSELDFDNLF